jgi:hypothetical protein
VQNVTTPIFMVELPLWVLWQNTYVRSFFEDAELGPVEALLAIEEIRQLKSRYFQAVDEKDWDSIAEVFTEDATIDFSGESRHHIGHHGFAEADAASSEGSPVTGGREAARVIAGAVQDLVTVHHGHDPQITLIGRDAARGRWSMYDRLDYGSEVMHGYGHYHEEYRRQGGRWRIAALTLVRSRVVWAPA